MLKREKPLGESAIFWLGWLLLQMRPAPLAVCLKRLMRIHRRTLRTSLGAFWVDPASLLGVTLRRHDVHEPPMICTVSHFLSAGSVFVDIGANEGYFSVIAAQFVGPSGVVCAVEPQQRLLPVLKRNFELNGISNATPFCYAISDHDGTEDFMLAPDTSTGSSSLRRSTRYRLAVQSVSLTTLEQLFECAGIDQCDLLKMDIEGYEYEAILGSRRLFEQHRIRTIALELHPELLGMRGLNETDLVEFLLSCGYTIDQRFDNLVLVVAGQAEAS